MSFELLPITWHPAANFRPLEAGQVHLWLADLDLLQQKQDVRSELSDEEIHRYSRILAPHRAASRIAARAFLRLILQKYTKIPARDLILESLPGGKPGLHRSQNPQGFQFNLSHSGKLALFGIGIGSRLGVDLEILAPLSEIQHISAYLPGSQGQLNEPHSLLAAWTRREAFLKALGDGWKGANEPEPTAGWARVTFSPSEYSVASLAVEAEINPADFCGYCY